MTEIGVRQKQYVFRTNSDWAIVISNAVGSFFVSLLASSVAFHFAVMAYRSSVYLRLLGGVT